jgi:lauroyl/myristoyl acyltransferase
MTPDWIVAHARRQQRHFQWCEAAYRWLPERWHARVAAAIAREFSPELPEAPKIWRGLQQFTGCSDVVAHRLLAQWYANQGAFALELHDYPQLDVAWARERVRCEERDVLAELVARGGLVLTYHSHHHNRLGAFLGLSGTKVWGIAATEENSLWKPWTGRWVRLINGGSESHFGGGSYLFTDQMRHLLVRSRHALRHHETVVSLCDNASDQAGAVRVDFGGRTLPVATGMIDLALALGAPVTYALFYSDLRGGHNCRLALAPGGANAAGIAQAYIAQLIAWLHRDPYAWQGWAWWEDLPPTSSAPATDPSANSDSEQHFRDSQPVASWKVHLLRKLTAVQSRLSPDKP